jgi:enamine deaminase RidA (YjgF/YER057c/UK114 family)
MQSKKVNKNQAAEIINLAIKEIHSIINEESISPERVKMIHVIVDSMKKIHDLSEIYKLDQEESYELSAEDLRIMKNYVQSQNITE